MDEERRVESDPEDTAPALKTFLREIKPCHRSSSKTHGVLAVGNLSILKKGCFRRGILPRRLIQLQCTVSPRYNEVQRYRKNCSL